MFIKFPPSISEYQERALKCQIQELSLACGLMFLKPDTPGEGTNIPVTLHPTPFSRHGFEAAITVQPLFHELYRTLVQKPELVQEILGSMDDPFTQKLLHIALNSPQTQPLTGGVFRSDYIVDKARTSTDEGRQIKQVEFNTVSVSLAGLSTKITRMHRFLAETATSAVHGEVPISDSLVKVATGLAAMHDAYDAGDQETVVLVVTQPGEKNVADQRLIEIELLQTHSIVCVRASLEQIARKTTIDESGRLIFVPTGAEVSVVYFRAGYTPNDYPTETEWLARERLEASHAIQCPSVLTQLTGMKKIQQVLTDSEFMERLAPNLSKPELELLKKTFVKMYPLDESPLGLEARQLAFEEPHRFVLKPQREGGNNNVFKEEIPEFLNSIDKSQWSSYVLMELIDPPKISNKMLRGDTVVSARITNELGVYGTVIWDTKKGTVLHNETAGFMLRTKPQTTNETGLSSGQGYLDAVMLPSR